MKTSIAIGAATLAVALHPLTPARATEGGLSCGYEARSPRIAAQAKGSECEGDPVLMDVAASASPAQLLAQYEALRKIEDVRVTYDARGVPSHIYGSTSFKLLKDWQSTEARTALERAVQQIKPMLLAEGSEVLELEFPPHAYRHLSDFRLRQTIRGIPVCDGMVSLRMDHAAGFVSAIFANFLPDRGLPAKWKISADRAVQETQEWLEREAESRAAKLRAVPAVSGFSRKAQPLLCYRIGPVSGGISAPRLVWTVRFEVPGMPFDVAEVDALDGSIVTTGASGSWPDEPADGKAAEAMRLERASADYKKTSSFQSLETIAAYLRVGMSRREVEELLGGEHLAPTLSQAAYGSDRTEPSDEPGFHPVWALLLVYEPLLGSTDPSPGDRLQSWGLNTIAE